MSANEVLLIAIGIIIGVGLAILVFLPAHPVRPKRPAATPPAVSSPPRGNEIPQSFLKKVFPVSFSSNIHVTTHKLQVQRVGDNTEFIVDSTTYQRVEDIPDPKMREQAQSILARLPSLTPTDKDALALALSKDDSLEASGDKIVVQTVNGRSHFTINDMTYNSLDEIPDPALRERVSLILRNFPS